VWRSKGVDEEPLKTKTYRKVLKYFNELGMNSRKATETYSSYERSLTCYHETSFYDGGYLFLINSDCLVRILDVASGTFLHYIRMEPSSFDSIIYRVNSNYVVMAKIKNGHHEHSTLYVYDMKCLKETDVMPTHLLTTIDLKRKVKRMTMNETRIVCLSHDSWRGF
jgi:hypothetical protein